ncbi:PorP/SprF family type IX secretion system membrane protein [Mucilaginibacter sp. RS28]|uniref:PorP/SprF family type IX secretion system membrane protein n=1 Tax=Mucilaginibacter straminoryzae TaxID=2932774 RepID=A0A9X1X5M3_9SPHI|nr:PorP/SprF family type IX secretion system membrane protein [Mucilaginibacter straminoryzae]MCJ8211542.1 PorP/SprF family type IX secretion system membrane protein [Mucilaginibacter straminoryzae]
MKKLLLILLTILGFSSAHAQDHMYSQFFNSPLYLNPALTGQFAGDLRMNMIYRNQWSGISSGTLSYFTGSIDYNVPQFGGGLGLMFNRSSEGTAFLNKNSLAGTYAYSVGSDDFILSFGLQAGITNRTIDFSKLVFSDQIDSRTGIINGSVSGAEKPAFDNRFYFDAGAGINLVVGSFMVGGAMQHLNRPDESFTGVKARLPIRTTAHVSYMLDLNKDENIDETEKSYVIPSVIMYKQAQSQNINVGFQYKRKSINAGLWYRNSGSGTPSAFVVSLIFDIFVNKDSGEKFRLGISHDASTSRLNYTNTSGTTEGSLSYETPLRSDGYSRFNTGKHCYDFY